MTYFEATTENIDTRGIRALCTPGESVKSTVWDAAHRVWEDSPADDALITIYGPHGSIVWDGRLAPTGAVFCDRKYGETYLTGAIG